MSKFELLRYVKKWRWMIVLLMIVGIYFVYSYANKNQYYSATAYIRYTNSRAAEGLTPNGSELDVKEIIGSSVISDTIKELGIYSSIENIRNRCRVEEIIPPDVQSLIDTALEDGEEYEYFPVDYRISYTCGSDYSRTYALRVLDSIINNYFNFYSENYISSVATPNNALHVNTEKYDYLNCVEMLDSTVNQITAFLDEKVTEQWTFRSSATGYSFQDLSDIYSYYQEYTIPGLYAYVLDNGASNNIDALVNNYKDRVSTSTLKLNNLTTHIDRIHALMEQYSDKSKQGMEYHYGTTETSNYILNNVYDWEDETVTTETVYDKLVLEYADLKVQYEQLGVDVERCNYILDAFSSVKRDIDPDSQIAKYLDSSINGLASEMNNLYSILWTTVEEYNSFRSAQDISMLTNISTQEGINVTLYVAVAVVLFGFIGFFAAVILGRLGDMLEYFVYIDRHVGIYNRAKCDMVIEAQSHKMLSENFTCLVINIANLANINTKMGRVKCDAMQSAFAKLLQENVKKTSGFAGYNGRGQFIALLENTSGARAKDLFDFIVRTYSSNVEETEGAEAAKAFDFHTGIACSSEENQYQIRDLLRVAIKRSLA